MAGRRVEIEIDPDFEIHTSFHNDFFLLRIRVLVNGENTEIRSIGKAKYKDPVLNFSHSGSTISTKLHLISSTVSAISVQYGHSFTATKPVLPAHAAARLANTFSRLRHLIKYS